MIESLHTPISVLLASLIGYVDILSWITEISRWYSNWLGQSLEILIFTCVDSIKRKIFTCCCTLLHHNLNMTVSVFPHFPHLLTESPKKNKINKNNPFLLFIQAASLAVPKHNCFPLQALLFPGMLISCDDQKDTWIKVLCFKLFVVMLLP